MIKYFFTVCALFYIFHFCENSVLNEFVSNWADGKEVLFDFTPMEKFEFLSSYQANTIILLLEIDFQ